MSDTDPGLQEDQAPPVDDGSIRAGLERLVASGRELVEAELGWAKLKTAFIAEGLRKSLFFAMLAVIFLVTGIAVLIVAAIMALAPLAGWLGACLIVAGISILVAVIAALAARRTVRALFKGNTP